MLNPGFWFGDVALNSDEYIKVIGITAALLLFGLINSVSAIVFPESSDDSAVEKISINLGSPNEHDIQSAFIFGSRNHTNDSIIFTDTMASLTQLPFTQDTSRKNMLRQVLLMQFLSIATKTRHNLL